MPNKTIKQKIAPVILTVLPVLSVMAAGVSVTGEHTTGSEKYFCVGDVTATVTPSDPAPTPKPSAFKCCSTDTETGSWIPAGVRYQWYFNNAAAGNSEDPSKTVTLVAGTNKLTCQIQYEFACSTTGNSGFSTETVTAIADKTAYVDDETTTPTIPAPNPNPNYSLPDINGDIHFADSAGTLFMYKHYYSGSFEKIKASDTYDPLSGGSNAGHTSCGETGKSLSFPGASTGVGVSVGMSGSRAGVGVSGSVSLSASVGSTGTGSGPYGENHKMVYWQVYKRETQVTALSAKAGAYHKVKNLTTGAVTNEGAISTSPTLPSAKQATGHMVKTTSLSCCPNT